jgi:hypothetical protein
VSEVQPEGAFDDEALRRTLGAWYGVGADAGLPDELRFLVGVAMLIRKRLRRGELQGERQLAVFFLHPDPPQAPGDRSSKRFPMLDNGIERVSGRLWFVNKMASDGTAVDLRTDDDDAAVFALAVDHLAIGDVPAVVLETRTPEPEARYYPQGLGNTEEFRTVRILASDVSVKEVFEIIDRLHEQSLCTPDAQGVTARLWVDSRRGWPAEDAEAKVQEGVRTILMGRFPTCRIRVEQVQATGRLDVEIEEPTDDDRALTVRHMVLELKVLRAKRSSGTPVPEAETLDWVQKGVEQAFAYRQERGSRAAALCCFDMRPVPLGQACFDHVRAVAEQLKVELGCWHIFSSSEAYRAYLAQSATVADI